MKIGVAQINPTVGDLAGNSAQILRTLEQAEKSGCALVVFPELALTGYPPEDLLFKPSFIKDARATLKTLAESVDKVAALVGTVDQQAGQLFNAAAWLEKKKIRTVYHKQLSPITAFLTRSAISRRAGSRLSSRFKGTGSASPSARISGRKQKICSP